MQDYHKLRRQCLQSNTLFEDPYFPANDGSLFFSQKLLFTPVWKRPKVREGREERAGKGGRREGGREERAGKGGRREGRAGRRREEEGGGERRGRGREGRWIGVE